MGFRAIKQDQKIPFIPAANKIRMLKMTEHDPMMLQVFRRCLFNVEDSPTRGLDVEEQKTFLAIICSRKSL
jgi:hypothetical protein